LRNLTRRKAFFVIQVLGILGRVPCCFVVRPTSCRVVEWTSELESHDGRVIRESWQSREDTPTRSPCKLAAVLVPVFVLVLVAAVPMTGFLWNEKLPAPLQPTESSVDSEFAFQVMKDLFPGGGRLTAHHCEASINHGQQLRKCSGFRSAQAEPPAHRGKW